MKSGPWEKDATLPTFDRSALTSSNAPSQNGISCHVASNSVAFAFQVTMLMLIPLFWRSNIHYLPVYAITPRKSTSTDNAPISLSFWHSNRQIFLSRQRSSSCTVSLIYYAAINTFVFVLRIALQIVERQKNGSDLIRKYKSAESNIFSEDWNKKAQKSERSNEWKSLSLSSYLCQQLHTFFRNSAGGEK